MKSNYTFHYSLLLVLLAHAGVLGAVLFAPESPAPVEVEPPTIRGIIIASEPTKPLEPLAPPVREQQEHKPILKPNLPLPKASPAERAIKEDNQPVPAPQIEPQKVTEPASTSVVPPSADASQMNNTAPVYPALSRRLREEGIVLLEILVKADGSIGEMRLKKTSGSTRLDDAAMRAVKSWHFLPAKRGGEAVDFWYELPIEFSLNH